MSKGRQALRNAEAGFLVARARCRADYAEAALLKAAKYIRAGVPLPPALAEYLSSSIEGALTNPRRHDPHYRDSKARALLVALGLAANNRRPATYHDSVIIAKVRHFVDAGYSQNKAISIVGSGFGLSSTTIKELLKKS